MDIRKKIEELKIINSMRFIKLVNYYKYYFGRHPKPLVSIIIVTFNNVEYTRFCIWSIYAKTIHPNFELIIVDNASTDGTREYLNSLKEKWNNIKIIINDKNLGFAAANNIGIKESKGSYIIFLNNDTIVTRGWISGLIKYLRGPEVGIVGPVTNSIGNEARIEVSYKNLIEELTYQNILEMGLFAKRYSSRNRGVSFDIPVLALYCAAIRREMIDKIGLLDERFSIGMFEDDDYCMRIRNAGFKVICAEDVFIHHFGGLSFFKLVPEEYHRIFNENRKKYELKWGIEWVPHKLRD